jgi:hypothetical protein
MNRVDRAAGVRLITDHPSVHAAPPVTAPVEIDLSDDDFVPAGLKAWAGRTSDGFHVQGLVDGEGSTFVTCVLNGVCETLEIAPEKALDAYLHPFAYGFTLPL